MSTAPDATPPDDRDRRDARTVETVFAVLLGAATFLALVLAGVGADHLLRLTAHVSLRPVVPGLVALAAAAGVAVVVRTLLRARGRGL